MMMGISNNDKWWYEILWLSMNDDWWWLIMNNDYDEYWMTIDAKSSLIIILQMIINDDW